MKRLTLGAALLFAVASHAIEASGQVKKRVRPRPGVQAAAKSAGDAFYREGLKCPAADYDCQVAAFTKAINLKLSTAAVFKARGNAYVGQQEYAKAIADLKKANALDLNDASIHKSLARIFLTLGEPGLAIRSLTSAAELEPKDISIYKERSTLFTLTGNQPRAIDDLSKAIILSPADIGLYETRLEKYLDQRVYDKAIADYTTLIGLKPDNAGYYGRRAQLYFSQKNFDAAFKDYIKVIELLPNDANAYVIRASAYFVNKNYDKALGDYDKAIALAPNNPELFVRRGRLQQETKNIDKALDDYSKAIGLDARSLWALNSRGNLYQSQKKYDLAIEDFTKAITSSPDSLESLLGRAAAYRALGKYDSAIEDLSKVISIDSENENALKLRGEVCAHVYGGTSSQCQNDWKKWSKIVISNATRAIALDPRNTDAYIRRGEAYLSAATFDYSQRQKARDDFEKAVGLNPNSAKAHAGLGKISRWDEHLNAEGEVLELKKAIELDPTDESSYGRIFYVLYGLNKQAEALEFVTKGIEANPGSAPLYKSRGLLYQFQQDNTKALNDFQKAIEMGDDDWKALNLIWILKDYPKMNKAEQAIAIVEAAVRQNPTSAWTYRNRGMFYNWMRTPQSKASAFADYRKAIELAPKNVDLYREYADLFVEGRDYDQALQILNKGLEIDPDSLWLHLSKGNVYCYQKNNSQAVAEFGKVLQLDRESKSFTSANLTCGN